MFAFDAHTCDFVACSVMSIRNYFRPSNGLSEPTGCISGALKSREQRTSSPPFARSAEYFLHPVTVYILQFLPLRRKNSEHTCDIFQGKCPMIVPLSQPQCIDRKHFRALFRTPTTLRLPPPILLCIRGSLEYNISVRKTLPWQSLSPYVFPPTLATLLQMLCCKIFVLKYFHRTSTLQKFFNTKIFSTKISQFTVVYLWI